MAKELPYFRFTPQEWQNGDISLESYELRGLFIDVCCYYWVKDCSITTAMLDKRYSNDRELIQQLINLGIIGLQENQEFIKISFLDDQFDILSEQRKRRQEAGSRGGKQKSSNAKAKLKQKSSYKDKDKDNYKLIEEFKNQNHEALFMQMKIDPKLMDQYINEFTAKLIASESDINNQKEVNQWWFNWLKLQPKKDLKYLTDEERSRKGLNPKRTYIWSNIDGSNYAGLMSDEEKKRAGFDINKVVTINNNVL